MAVSRAARPLSRMIKLHGEDTTLCHWRNFAEWITDQPAEKRNLYSPEYFSQHFGTFSRVPSPEARFAGSKSIGAVRSLLDGAETPIDINLPRKLEKK